MMTLSPISINLDKLIKNLDIIEWDAHKTLGKFGARISRLHQCNFTGQQVALIHCPPGTRADAHTHMGHESFLVLDGQFQDESGIYEKGDLVIYEPGSSHSWFSTTGTLIYAVWGGIITPVVNSLTNTTGGPR